jgi:hypothetical protein
MSPRLLDSSVAGDAAEPFSLVNLAGLVVVLAGFVMFNAGDTLVYHTKLHVPPLSSHAHTYLRRAHSEPDLFYSSVPVTPMVRVGSVAEQLEAAATRGASGQSYQGQAQPVLIRPGYGRRRSRGRTEDEGDEVDVLYYNNGEVAQSEDYGTTCTVSI